MYELRKSTGEDEVSPKEYLQAVEFLLSDDAEDWLETHHKASSLLNVKEPTQEDVE